jgi:hypothetical protein
LPVILQFGNIEQKALTGILEPFETIWFQMKSPKIDFI